MAAGTETNQDAGAFVVIAEFEVKRGQVEAFMAAALNDARHSVADEPGCRQFDVIRPEDQDTTVVFYEVYDSRAAFGRHLETPHLARFRAAFPPLIVAERPVRFGRRAADGFETQIR